MQFMLPGSSELNIPTSLQTLPLLNHRPLLPRILSIYTLFAHLLSAHPFYQCLPVTNLPSHTSLLNFMPQHKPHADLLR